MRRSGALQWERDWGRLQTEQRRDERRPDVAPPARPAEKALEQHREENYEAAENAYREQQVLRERKKREAEKPRPVPPGHARRPTPRVKQEKQGKPTGDAKPE